MHKIFGREPAVFWSLVAGLVLALLQLIPMPTAVNGALNAVTLAAAGLVTAAMVATDKVLPALVGLIQAVFALFLALGTPVAETTQTGILALVAAGAAFFVRGQVDAKVMPSGSTLSDQHAAEAYLHGFEKGADSMVPKRVVTMPEGQPYTATTAEEYGGAHEVTTTMPAVDEGGHAR